MSKSHPHFSRVRLSRRAISLPRATFGAGLYRCLLSLALVTSASAAQAHFFAPSHDCRAPQKPLEFTTETDRVQFEEKVKAFRACLEDFVDNQNKAADKHQQAGEAAASAWKDYAEQVLKAKVKPAPEQ